MLVVGKEKDGWVGKETGGPQCEAVLVFLFSCGGAAAYFFSCDSPVNVATRRHKWEGEE